MIETDRVHQVHELYVGRKQFYDIFSSMAVERIDNMVLDINEVIQECKALIEKRFVKMANKKVWFDREVAGIYPMLEHFDMPYFNAYSQDSFYIDANDDSINTNIEADNEGNFIAYHAENLKFVVPTPEEATTTFAKVQIDLPNPYMYEDMIKFIKPNNRFFYASDATSARRGLLYYKTNGDRDYCDDYEIALIPIYRLNGVDSAAMNVAETVYVWMGNNLIPQGLSKKQQKNYERLMSAVGTLEEYLDWDEDPDMVLFDDEKFKADVLAGRFREKIFDFDFNVDAVIDAVMSGNSKLEGSLNGLKRELLLADKHRVDLQPYAEEQLMDIRKGHWELFDMLQMPSDNEEGEQKEKAMITLPDGVVWAARPPQMDVHINGVCSIDFGTKSTVVACMEQETLLQRIGANSFNKKVTMRDYENPTCIELRDIDGFLEAYHAREGRPLTKWEQITVSHQAAETLLGEELDSSVYYSVFSELKQWANAKNRRLMLRDRCKGVTYELKPYLELEEGDFDPIEVYAYYLGLAINNMYNGIYLNYIMSFPVNYGKEVRDKLLTSFKKGLFKSLPISLQQDKDFIEENFSVYAGASEPAAYAMAALKELDLEPKDKDGRTAYGVFDFGGGTTDFDFGIERMPENRRRYKFEIEQFGQGGDVYLGGENILNVLAYEVYKRNFAQMRANNITIVLPPNCTKIAGSEGLVLDERDATQMAYMNRKCIAEKMRPIWERHDGYETLLSTPLKIKLYSSETISAQVYELNIKKDDIEKTIRRLIEGGVDNFFDAWKTAFKDREEMPIHILLAGNSCLSPVVKEVFDERISKMEENNIFTLHMPLGMNQKSADEDSIGKQDMAVDENDTDIEDEKTAIVADFAYLNSEEDDSQDTGENNKQGEQNKTEDVSEEEMNFNRRITGKTGVVFGLLRSRKGGRDVKVINHNEDVTGEMNFPFYIGEIGENDTFEVVISRDVEYGDWQPFCYADVNEFEVYFTSKPAAVNNSLNRRDVNMVKCKFDEDDVSESDEVQVYIRKVSPDTIEYTVGTQEEIEEINREDGEEKIYKRVLREI